MKNAFKCIGKHQSLHVEDSLNPGLILLITKMKNKGFLKTTN